MEIEKIKDITVNFKNKSNKELLEVSEILINEFEKTKDLIIELTLHLESVENNFNNIKEELKIRKIL